MNDIRVEIKFRNNLLIKEIKQKYNTMLEFATKANVSIQTIYNILRFAIEPTTKINTGYPIINGYYWKISTVKICKCLNCNPLHVFPVHLWDKRKSTYKAEIDSSQMLPYNENYMIPYSAEVDESAVEWALNRLNPREKNILKLRFGFNGDELGLSEIGEKYNVSRGRIRQIEAKALRRLRHPACSRVLRGEEEVINA